MTFDEIKARHEQETMANWHPDRAWLIAEVERLRELVQKQDLQSDKLIKLVREWEALYNQILHVPNHIRKDHATDSQGPVTG